VRLKSKPCQCPNSRVVPKAEDAAKVLSKTVSRQKFGVIATVNIPTCGIPLSLEPAIETPETRTVKARTRLRLSARIVVSILVIDSGVLPLCCASYTDALFPDFSAKN
jgi:hypothetical protein